MRPELWQVEDASGSPGLHGVQRRAQDGFRPLRLVHGVIDETQIVAGDRVIRITLDGSTVGGDRLVELPGDHQMVMSPRVFSLHLGQPVPVLHRLGQRSDPALPLPQPVKHSTQAPICRSEAGVERDRLFEQGYALGVVHLSITRVETLGVFPQGLQRAGSHPLQRRLAAQGSERLANLLTKPAREAIYGSDDLGRVCGCLPMGSEYLSSRGRDQLCGEQKASAESGDLPGDDGFDSFPNRKLTRQAWVEPRVGRTAHAFQRGDHLGRRQDGDDGGSGEIDTERLGYRRAEQGVMGAALEVRDENLIALLQHAGGEQSGGRGSYRPQGQVAGRGYSQSGCDEHAQPYFPPAEPGESYKGRRRRGRER